MLAPVPGPLHGHPGRGPEQLSRWVEVALKLLWLQLSLSRMDIVVWKSACVFSARAESRAALRSGSRDRRFLSTLNVSSDYVMFPGGGARS